MLDETPMNLNISVPTVYDQYTLQGIDKRGIKQRINTELVKRYSGTSLANNAKASIMPLFFSNYPITFAEGLYKAQKEKVYPIEMVISCYDSYQLSELPTPPLYLKKALDLETAQAFSIGNQGSLSLITSLHLFNIYKKTGILSCLEQINSIYEQNPIKNMYEKREAISLIQVSEMKLPLKVRKYRLEHVSELNQTLNDLAAISIKQIHSILLQMGMDQEEIMIIPHCFSKDFEERFTSNFQNVYVRSEKYNLSTCDPFYSLKEYLEQKSDLRYIFLNIIDPLGVGCILLEANNIIQNSGGE
ncbi:hypothetical protein [Cytobacillus pseudoceanisediminis]|uniref:hypothetical protein n=1 Tax=Cytobacillus pseudoceanisediminis TaxID=3051614 RepID=UPI003C2CAEA1